MVHYVHHPESLDIQVLYALLILDPGMVSLICQIILGQVQIQYLYKYYFCLNHLDEVFALDIGPAANKNIASSSSLAMLSMYLSQFNLDFSQNL